MKEFYERSLSLATAGHLREETRPMSDLFFPALDPYNQGTLKVSDLHTLYYEECGNPKGRPVVFLHGGPGGGIDISPHYASTWRHYFPPILPFQNGGKIENGGKIPPI